MKTGRTAALSAFGRPFWGSHLQKPFHLLYHSGRAGAMLILTGGFDKKRRRASGKMAENGTAT